MFNSLMEIGQIQEYEEIASFGGALLMKHRSHKFKIVGGTREERRRAAEWAARFLKRQNEKTCVFSRIPKMNRLTAQILMRRNA
jgi:hypothetical protein